MVNWTYLWAVNEADFYITELEQIHSEKWVGWGLSYEQKWGIIKKIVNDSLSQKLWSSQVALDVVVDEGLSLREKNALIKEDIKQNTLLFFWKK